MVQTLTRKLRLLLMTALSISAFDCQSLNPIEPSVLSLQMASSTWCNIERQRYISIEDFWLKTSLGYFTAVSSDSFGPWDIASKTWSENCAKVKFSIYTFWSETRDSSPNTKKHRRRTAALFKGQGKIQGSWKCHCMENEGTFFV